MDDVRINWIQKKVTNAFSLKEEKIFSDFITFNDGINETNLLSFLNEPCCGEGKSVVFYVTQEEHQEEIEIEIGNICLFLY